MPGISTLNLPTTGPPPPVVQPATLTLTNVTQSKSITSGQLAAAIGDTVTLNAALPGGVPAIISVNGKFFYSPAFPVSVTVDVAGRWHIVLETPGVTPAAVDLVV